MQVTRKWSSNSTSNQHSKLIYRQSSRDMRLPFVVIAILIVAEQASLTNGHSRFFLKAITDASAAALLPSQPHVDETVRRAADVVLARALDSSPSIGVATPAVSGSTLSVRSDDSVTWEKETESACQNALSKISMSSISPSGMTACYNIRYFDNSTGVFQSDLRFYRVAPPAGNWTMFDTKQMSIGISCKGASLAQANPDMRKRDRRDGRAFKAPRRNRPTRRSNTSTPQALQVLQFVGKLHDGQKGITNDRTSMRSSLTPTIFLSGTTKDGTELRTEIPPPQDASFLNGAFADNQTKDFPSSTNPGGRSSSPPAQSSAARTTEFLIPGRTLGIFPVGFVITMIWTFFFVLVIGLGTFDRIRFREAYRRRLERERTVGMRMI